MVVLIPPYCGQPPRSRQAVKLKLLRAAELIPQLTVEARGIAIFPWGSWFNIERLYFKTLQPLPDLDCDELGAVITPDVLRQPARAT